MSQGLHKNLLYLILLSLSVFSACSNIQVTKRHYRSGWHVSSDWKSRTRENVVFIDTVKTEFVSTGLAKLKTDRIDFQEQKYGLRETHFKSENSNKKKTTQDQLVAAIQQFPKQYPKQAQIAKSHSLNSRHTSFLWFALAPLFVLLAFPYKRLSRWGSKNKRFSQVTILLSSFLLATIALLFGAYAGKNTLAIPTMIGYSAPFVSILAMVFYPSGKNTSGNYKQRKLSDAILLGSGLVSSFYIGNQIGQGNPIKSLIGSWIEKFVSHVSGFIVNHFDFSSLIPDPDGQITFLYFAEGVLIFLSVVLYLLLMIITFSLACNVSCSGNVAGGNAIIIGGLVLFTTGLVFLIRTIHNQLRKKRDRLRNEEEFQ